MTNEPTKIQLQPLYMASPAFSNYEELSAKIDNIGTIANNILRVLSGLIDEIPTEPTDNTKPVDESPNLFDILGVSVPSLESEVDKELKEMGFETQGEINGQVKALQTKYDEIDEYLTILEHQRLNKLQARLIALSGQQDAIAETVKQIGEKIQKLEISAQGGGYFAP